MVNFAISNITGTSSLPVSVSEYWIWTGVPVWTVLLTISWLSNSFSRSESIRGFIPDTPFWRSLNLVLPRKSSRTTSMVQRFPSILKPVAIGHPLRFV